MGRIAEPLPVVNVERCLPGTEFWDYSVSEVRSRMHPSWEMRGSLDDYFSDFETGNINIPPRKLVRVELSNNGYFVMGVVHTVKDMRHQSTNKPYWVEVWPSKSLILAREALQHERYEDHDRYVQDQKLHFECSDPRVRICYKNVSIEFHRIFPLHIAEREAGKVKPFLPKPMYVHPQQ